MPVAVAKHRVALFIFIDDESDWLVSDFFYLCMQGLGEKIASAVDHHHAISGYQERIVVVVSGIFVDWWRSNADGSPYIRNRFDRFRVKN